MQTLSSQYSFYTYLKVSPEEDYVQAVNKLIKRMKSKGYKYDPGEYGDWRGVPQDDDYEGTRGSPMFFIKKPKQ